MLERWLAMSSSGSKTIYIFFFFFFSLILKYFGFLPYKHFWYALIYPKHLPACFQLLPISPGWNNPYCLVPSKSIAVSRSPAKSALILSRAVPQISPVAGFRTLSLPHCLLVPSRLPPRLPIILALFHGSWVPAPPQPHPSQQRRDFPGEMKRRHGCDSFVPFPAQVSRRGGWASPHKEGTPPPQLQPVVPLSSVFQ